MKKQSVLSLGLIILFLLSWSIYHLADPHDHPLVLTQKLNSFEDNSGSITFDKEDQKRSFIQNTSQKYSEKLLVLMLLLIHCSALILHLRRRIMFGPVFYQSNNVVHSF